MLCMVLVAKPILAAAFRRAAWKYQGNNCRVLVQPTMELLRDYTRPPRAIAHDLGADHPMPLCSCLAFSAPDSFEMENSIVLIASIQPTCAIADFRGRYPDSSGLVLSLESIAGNSCKENKPTQDLQTTATTIKPPPSSLSSTSPPVSADAQNRDPPPFNPPNKSKPPEQRPATGAKHAPRFRNPPAESQVSDMLSSPNTKQGQRVLRNKK
ncbi:hypothetical protein J3F83DRAFT_749195 [Trichoderma novae-zelandiae]